MRKIIKTTFLTVILLANLVPTFGQTTSDKIIFLTDFYTTFLNKAKADNKSADSIYKETIHTSIYDKYFKKSEYGYIVKDFLATPIKNTSELKKSIDRISLNQETIKAKIAGALKKSRQNIDNDSLTIYIIPVNPDSRQLIEGMTGIMGLTAGSKQIILTIEPDVAGWENMLEYAVAHEFNHAYWTNMNFGKSTKWTLLDYLVFEGRGDYFAHMLYPNVIAPWTISLTENQKSDLWNKIKPNLQSEDISYQMEVMFGSRNYPVWGGYSVGYDLVLTALTNNKKIKAINWTNLEAVKILELSKYK
ncbi:DUF2268 domain-containing putative Zn-dependent protease [Flavobacterium sp. GT3R68]|uniref:DUF2268 domain-containing putative Zn-dependent protease n=1 Tax=Flavobacterium sp. GT3R68 TaxID=2594437 RepID=UPI000F87E969|nr:DUF2268 domain-containing putative Zn-dependent protease [Flavobacterium sp. GT3R68]RTY86316.1 hypothetical protein EKL32_27865 [Flavobacterium sp. GSN2]TRW91924.1 hypothetical protein FNW07_08550 [Flavobacterium sp. GT3R68]